MKKKRKKTDPGLARAIEAFGDQVLGEEPDYAQYVAQVAKAAAKRGLTKELAIFLSYFVAARQLMELTGGSNTTLRVLTMVTPAQRLRGVIMH